MADDRFADFYRVNFRASAEIDGVEVPISYFDVGYRADHIPDAVIHMPFGREARTGAVSTAQGIISNIRPFSTMKIYVTLNSPDGRAAPPGTPKGFKDGKTLIFDGYCHMPSYENSNAPTGGGQGMSLTGFGKLGALAGSTQFIQGVSVATRGIGTGLITARLGNVGRVSSDVYGMLTKLTIEDDLFGSGILPLMDTMANSISVWTEERNDFASVALKRLSTYGIFPAKTLDLSPLTGPDVPSGYFRRGLAVTMGNDFFNTWATPQSEGNFWNALMLLAAHFRFHIVPAIEEDGALPIVWNLGGDPYITFNPSEYTVFKRKSTGELGSYTYVTRIGIKSGVFTTGEVQDKLAYATSIGYAEIDEDKLGGLGQLRLVEAPIWILPTEASGSDSLNPGAQLPDPAQPSPPNQPPPPARKQGQNEIDMLSSKLGNGLAKLILHDNLFFHRRALLSGRFRLDVAPGSLVRIITPGERFTGGSETLYAMVQEARLSGGNRGQDSFASTTFSFLAVRSNKEHETISSDEEEGALTHPLYEGAQYRGAPLINLE